MGAEMEGKQQLKKLVRTSLDEAPKKAPSAYALFRSENMERIAAENKGLACGALGKKVAEAWAAVPDEKKAEYQKTAADAKEKYDKDLLDFKRKLKYTQFLEKRRM